MLQAVGAGIVNTLRHGQVWCVQGTDRPSGKRACALGPGTKFSMRIIQTEGESRNEPWVNRLSRCFKASSRRFSDLTEYWLSFNMTMWLCWGWIWSKPGKPKDTVHRRLGSVLRWVLCVKDEVQPKSGCLLRHSRPLSCCRQTCHGGTGIEEKVLPQ